MKSIGHELFQAKLRLTLYNGAGVRKRVKGLEPYVVLKRLDVNVTDRAKGHSATRLKPVYQAFTLFAAVDLLRDRKKRFGRDNIQLEFTLVMNTILKGSLFFSG